MRFSFKARLGSIKIVKTAALVGLLGCILLTFDAQARMEAEMRLFSDSFISPTFESATKTNFQFVGARLQTQGFSDDILQMNITGAVAVESPLMNYLNISEIYTQIRQTESQVFYIGRKKSAWSQLDERWDFGVVEPLFKWNPLNPELQGLTGLFWELDKPNYSMTLFASPLFIPDQGPSFSIKNGSFTKGNPWFQTPPESIRIWDEATGINYSFEQPNEAEIVLQNSFGLKVALGRPQGLQVSGSYIYKPMNQLAIGYEGNLNLADLKGAVTIQPEVYYHSLAGVDLIYRSGPFEAGLNSLYDKPTQDEVFEEKWTRPVFSAALLTSPYVQWTYNGLTFFVQHLSISGGAVTEEGELASSERAPLMVRYQYQEATSLGVKVNYSFKKKRNIVGRLIYTHSEKNRFDLIRASARFNVSNLWSFVSELQMVKADPTDKDNQNEISRFANNDRLMFGVGYAF